MYRYSNRAAQHCVAPDSLAGAILATRTARSRFRSISFALCKAAGERYPLGRMWLVNKFDGDVIR